jgi:hypothetical protein
VIGVAAAGVMALGAQTVIAQTAAKPPAIVKYDTKLMITHEAVCTGKSPKVPGHAGHPLPHGYTCPKGSTHWHGRVESDRTECIGGRRVILFQQRAGADRKLGVGKSAFKDGSGLWGAGVAPIRGRVYARVTPKVGDGLVCRADRSITIEHGRLQDKKQGL